MQRKKRLYGYFKYQLSNRGGVVMTNTQLKCALMGGLIVFIWGLFSWMIFPWHQTCMKKFSCERGVADAIREYAPESGVYILPNTFHKENGCPTEMKKSMQMMENGPFVFAAVKLEGMGKMTMGSFVLSLILQVIGAFIATWMLMQTKGLSFFKQIGFFTLFGLSIGVLGLLPEWNWWGFSFCYVLVNMIDLVVGWTLAGFAVAKVLKR